MSDTPKTIQLLDKILDQDGVLEEQNAPFVWVRLAKTLERELNAAKAENEAMKKAVQTAADSLDGLDKHLPRNHGMFLLLALEKLQPFLK